MNILFILEGLNESTKIAQPWRHVVEISSRMKKMGHDVEIISEKYDRSKTNDEVLGVPVNRIKRNKFLLDIKELLYTINNINPDIINWHCSDVWSSIYFNRLKNKLKYNTIWTVHSDGILLNDLKNLNLSEFIQLYKFWNNILNSFAQKTLVKGWIQAPFLRHTITLSGRTARTLVNLGLGKEQVTPISSGVDIDTFYPSQNSVDDSNILYFGPPSTFRGIDTLYSAFKIIKKNIPDSKLIFLSRDLSEKSNWYKKFGSMDNTKVVCGILPQEDLINYLREASVIVLPFKFWPQVSCPLTILEGMALGKAIVTTPIGSINEIVRDGETGILVPAGKADKLSEAIIRLLNDPSEREKIGKNARMYVESFHNWDYIVDKTLKVYSKYN